jgi:peptidoglycan/xylan/chitin deacetylase (PgdA/CDA1 family)
VLARAVKLSAAAVDKMRPPGQGVVILLYHRIGGGSGLELDLPVPCFEKQMEWLASSGRLARLGDVLDDLSTADTAGPALNAAPRIVVTFDDGTADFAENAVPVLARCRVPVTLYAATAFIDEQRPMSDGVPPLSWNALRDACSTGLVDVGSHTHRHRLLDRLPPAAVAGELDRSIELIGQQVGTAPRDFAYPKAVPGSVSAEEAVRARFRSAALAGTRPNRFGATDVHRLARSPVQVGDGWRWFVHKAQGGMALEDGLRRLLNRRRYASLTT